MAHKILEDGRTAVDWETGDPEGDRKYLFKAYQDFISELIQLAIDSATDDAQDLLNKWGISIDNQVDDFPRIWIKRPE